MGEIVTFYSYKGGVGRTMSLANVAVLLNRWNYRVLLVDWDLEAPGLEYYFKDYTKISAVSKRRGIIDLLEEINKESSNIGKWKDYIVKLRIPDSKYKIHLLTAGIRNKKYFNRVQSIDIDNIYAQKDGGRYIESLRKEWKSSYDFILIDSRTGVTDIGGICTIQLPDMLVLLFGANEQSLDGAITITDKILTARQKMPVERLTLTVLPIAGRFDTQEEFLISQEWLNTFSERLKPFYADWLPASMKIRDIVEITKIPYIPYFSFGEKLPVIEQGTNDPASIGYAYENLSALIANKIEDIEILYDDRDKFVSRAYRKYAEEINVEAHYRRRPIGPYKYREAYLDIETTGLSQDAADIFIIGLYLVGDKETKLIQLVDKEINKGNLLGSLRGIKTIYTFNGERFDLPFIMSKLGINIEKEFNHIDLMYECWRRNIYGGFKAAEVKLGISRKAQGTSGYEMIRLWHEYVDKKNESVLQKILESNKEDVENLRILRDKLNELPEVSISPDTEINIMPLVGIEADRIDVASYVSQLENRNKPQDIRKIYRLTKSELDLLLMETIDNLNKLDVPKQIKEQDIIIEAEKFISNFESLTNKVEQFALASSQEGFTDGINIVLKFAGDWISISEKHSSGIRIKFVQGAPALLAWRMLCLSGAKALEEEAFDILPIILTEPIEVEEDNNRFTNLSLLKRHQLFHPESMLDRADLAVRYISKLWNEKLHLHNYFISDEVYNFALAKFLILVALTSSPDKYGHRLYPGYRLLPQARRAMSSFCSKLASSDKYLTEIAKLIGESSQEFKTAWTKRVESINNLDLGSGYFIIDQVHFPKSIGSDIPD